MFTYGKVFLLFFITIKLVTSSKSVTFNQLETGQSQYRILKPETVHLRNKSTQNDVYFFGYDISVTKANQQQSFIEIGSPKSNRHQTEEDSSINEPHPFEESDSFKDSGDIFRCDISDIIQSSTQTCQIITPRMKRKGNNFGLSLINSPYPMKKMAVSLTQQFDCYGHGYSQPGFIYTSNSQTSWKLLDSDPVISKPNCVSPHKVDVMFVLDGSGSVKKVNFQRMLIWTEKVGHNLMRNIGRSLRIGIIQFAQKVEYQVPLKTFSTTQEFDSEANITRTRFRRSTYTGKAMKKVRSLLMGRKPHPSARYENIMILLTDGKSSDAKSVEKQAPKLKSSGIKSFAVGVDSADENELRLIANGDESKVFSVTNFLKLNDIVDELQTKITATLEGTGSLGNVYLNYSLAQFAFSSTTTKQVQMFPFRVLLT